MWNRWLSRLGNILLVLLNHEELYFPNISFKVESCLAANLVTFDHCFCAKFQTLQPRFIVNHILPLCYIRPLSCAYRSFMPVLFAHYVPLRLISYVESWLSAALGPLPSPIHKPKQDPVSQLSSLPRNRAHSPLLLSREFNIRMNDPHMPSEGIIP